MKNPTNPGALVDRAGIREICGVTKARVHQMTDEPGFPAPFDVPSPRHPVWLRTKVEEFDRARREKAAPVPDGRIDPVDDPAKVAKPDETPQDA